MYVPLASIWHPARDSETIFLRCGRFYMKFPHSVIVKAPGLLPMLYKVSELSRALNIPDRTLRDWLEAGAPHQRDKNSHIWVNGKLFTQWVQNNRKPKRSARLTDGQAYCLKCRAIVELQSPKVIQIKSKLTNIRAVCPQCGKGINRGGRDGKTG